MSLKDEERRGLEQHGGVGPVSRNHVTVKGDGITVAVTCDQERLDRVVELATAAARELMEVQGLKRGATARVAEPHPEGPWVPVQPPATTDGYSWVTHANCAGELWAIPRE
jgi:hypothetical protein